MDQQIKIPFQLTKFSCQQVQELPVMLSVAVIKLMKNAVLSKKMEKQVPTVSAFTNGFATCLVESTTLLSASNAGLQSSKVKLQPSQPPLTQNNL